MSSAQWHEDQAVGEKAQREWDEEIRLLRANSDRLAKYILENVPGEPSESEGAVDCAIRIMSNMGLRLHAADNARDQLRRDLKEIADGCGVGCADAEEAKRRIIALCAVKSDMDSFPRPARRAVFSVLVERGRQDAKWGPDRSLDDRLWCTVLGEEFGEVCRAVLEHTNLREELVQVAAVAVAAIEDIDRRSKT